MLPCCLLLIPCGLACGQAPPDVTEGVRNLLPLSVGNRWEYSVTGSKGTKPEKTQSVTATTSVDGRTAFVLVTERGDKTVTSVQRNDEGRLVRLSEDTYDGGAFDSRVRFVPPALRINTTIARLGATYENAHTEEHLDMNDQATSSPVAKSETFTVEAVDESITVPAGTYRCVRVRRDTEGGPSKTYWFADGVGKIREVGGQTEALVRVDVSRPSSEVE